jgi:sulfite reductase alpha subunit-like flavoprotein
MDREELLNRLAEAVKALDDTQLETLCDHAENPDTWLDE